MLRSSFGYAGSSLAQRMIDSFVVISTTPVTCEDLGF